MQTDIHACIHTYTCSYIYKYKDTQKSIYFIHKIIIDDDEKEKNYVWSIYHYFALIFIECPLQTNHDPFIKNSRNENKKIKTKIKLKQNKTLRIAFLHFKIFFSLVFFLF